MTTYRCIQGDWGRARVHILGTTHWHAADAIRVLRFLEILQPKLLLVELPEGLKPVVEQGMCKVFPSALGFAITIRESAEAIVLSAGDSISHAIRWAMRTGTPWRCIDLAVPDREARREQELAAPDPWWALEQSEAYDAALAPVLARVPPPRRHLEREPHMVAAIRAHAAASAGPVVVILGAAHISRVAGLLKAAEDNLLVSPASRVPSANLAHVSGAALISRFLGPVPRLAQHLMQPGFVAENASTPNLRRLLHSYVNEAALDYEKVWNRRPGVDSMQRFWRVVHKKLTGDGGCLPSALDLIRTAEAVVDRDFALVVARRVIGDWHCGAARDNLPVLGLSDDHNSDRLIDRIGSYWIRGGGGAKDAAERAAWAERLQDAFGPKPERLFEPAELPKRRFSSFTTAGTRELWMEAVARVRRFIRQPLGVRAVRWNGGRLGRVDVHEMIHARCMGRTGIYHEQPCESATSGDDDEREDFFPTVWVFQDNPEQRCYSTYYFLRHNPQQVYCARPVLLRPDRTMGDVRYLQQIAGLVPWHFVCAERKKFLPMWLQTTGNRVPMRDPWGFDTGGQPKRPYEHLAMVALQFARRQVVLVTDTGTRTTALLRQAAIEQKKKLIEVRMSMFSPDEVEALRCLRFEPKWIEDEE